MIRMFNDAIARREVLVDLYVVAFDPSRIHKALAERNEARLGIFIVLDASQHCIGSLSLGGLQGNGVTLEADVCCFA